ncbi:MAG: ABC transporter substrate-binding protein [Methanomassiliicoccaceae archaeon]|jgi:ABC-type nitrate/sulfonate/bicarbonate transport system substrate-binding protein|nr:ABC transporter substrate-binding protein [Methanomassiliicoccaceae archaeon]
MNNVTVAVVVGFVLFFSIGTGFIVTSDTGETSNDPVVSVLAAVNYEGSGIFSDRMLDINDPAGWGGLVFMTPGPGTIQHEMLKSLTFSLGLYFALDRPTKNNWTVYWTQVAPGGMSDVFEKGTVNGGIVWEPWYSAILTKYPEGSIGGAYSVARSAEIEPGHPCCMVVVKNTFLEGNEELVIRFLLAYIEAVEWVNKAKAASDPLDPDHSLYLMLEKIAWETALNRGSPSALPTAADKITIGQALSGINFDYNLDGLKEYVATLIVRFANSGSITKQVNDPAAYADKLINTAVLNDIMGNLEDLKDKFRGTTGAGTIRLGVLANDLHQVAVRAAWGYDLTGDGMTLFELYGLNVVQGGDFQQGGGGVMNLFAQNVIDIGVLGLPPTVIRSANGL